MLYFFMINVLITMINHIFMAIHIVINLKFVSASVIWIRYNFYEDWMGAFNTFYCSISNVNIHQLEEFY